eukprot:3097891-Rhodomonas_salina.2
MGAKTWWYGWVRLIERRGRLGLKLRRAAYGLRHRAIRVLPLPAERLTVLLLVPPARPASADERVAARSSLVLFSLCGRCSLRASGLCPCLERGVAVLCAKKRDVVFPYQLSRGVASSLSHSSVSLPRSAASLFTSTCSLTRSAETLWAN